MIVLLPSREICVSSCSFCPKDGVCHTVGSLLNKCSNDECISVCRTSSCRKDDIDFVKTHQVTGRFCELRNNTPLENLEGGMGDIFIKLAR